MSDDDPLVVAFFLLLAVYGAIRAAGGRWWMYLVVAAVLVGGFVWAVQGPRICRAAGEASARIRARRYADEPEQVVEQVPAG